MNIKIKVNDKIYVKDPESSVLGKKIIENSILMIDEIGFEDFTFKKLGDRIGSNESSIYRYFESKHKLLVYLSSWYWSWIEYRLVFSTMNVFNPLEKLIKAIQIVTEKIQDNLETTHINEALLSKIVIQEFTKTVHTKEVDEENKEGYFAIYSRLITRLSGMIEEVNPQYPHAKSLASSIVEGALHQHFLMSHLESLTNCNAACNPSDFYVHLITTLLKSE